MASTWTPAAQAVWGKSDEQNGTSLPLVQHLDDAAAVAGLLWDRWLSTSVRRLLGSCLPGGEPDARLLLTWLAGVHDVGKVTPAFAVKQPWLTGRMRDTGLAFPATLPDARTVPHGMAGQVLVTRWMRECHDAPADVASTYACVVGGHHGVFPDRAQLQAAQARPHLLGERRWREVQHEILTGMTDRLGVDRFLAWAQHPLPAVAQVLMTGLVIVADWLASDEKRFPYGENRSGARRAATAWERLDLPPMWAATVPPRDVSDHMALRFPGRTPRPVQTALVEAAWDQAEPGLLVLEAAMGVGKTEAALMAAEVVAARHGCGGVFVALPTMATSDAMFERVHAWVENLPAGTRHSMFLAHGKARLNDEYRGLARLDEVAEVYEEGEDDDPQPQVVAGVLAWLTGRKKGPLANVVVGTVDQVLQAGLQAKHMVLRQLALMSKVVVIDEVHAADTYMRVYLCAVLRWFGQARVPVVLLSATLPAEQRAQMVSAYDAGVHLRAAGRGYPRVTTVVAGAMQEIDVPASPGSTSVQVTTISDEAVVDELRERLADGGCAAVIHNTVGRAQQTAARLREVFGPDEVVLVHSRFLAVDRARREADLRHRLGPPENGARRPGRLVVVGTQVLEQSLDIDVDLMVSDLAPVDLLLQRVGRLHRHRRSGRPRAVSTAVLLVTGADWSTSPPQLDRGSRHVYGRAALLRAAGVVHDLPGQAHLTLPADIPRLVEAAHDPLVVPGPAAWQDEIADADADDARREGEAVGRARSFLLPDPPVAFEAMNGTMRSTVRDQPEDGRAQVRDSEDGLEVLVVQHIGDEVRVLAGDRRGATVPVDSEPEPQLALAVAVCSLRLPASLTHPGVIDAVLGHLEQQFYPGWQASPWLKGQLVLELDHDLRAVLPGHRLRYDEGDGLVVAREEEVR